MLKVNYKRLHSLAPNIIVHSMGALQANPSYTHVKHVANESVSLRIYRFLRKSLRIYLVDV